MYEQMLDTLQETISMAIEYHSEVTVTYHRNKRNNKVLGHIRKVDLNMKTIKIESLSGNESLTLPLQSIINIQISE